MISKQNLKQKVQRLPSNNKEDYSYYNQKRTAYENIHKRFFYSFVNFYQKFAYQKNLSLTRLIACSTMEDALLCSAMLIYRY